MSPESKSVSESTRALTLREWGILVSILAALIAVAAWFHSTFVAPSLLQESRKIVREELILDKANRKEVEDARRDVLAILQAQLGTLATRESIDLVLREIADIKTRLRALESRNK